MLRPLLRFAQRLLISINISDPKDTSSESGIDAVVDDSSAHVTIDHTSRIEDAVSQADIEANIVEYPPDIDFDASSEPVPTVY